MPEVNGMLDSYRESHKFVTENRGYWDRANDDSKVYLGGWTGSLTGGGGAAMPYKTMFTGAFQEYKEWIL